MTGGEGDGRGGSERGKGGGGGREGKASGEGVYTFACYLRYN